MRHTITEKVTGWIDDAITKFGQGESSRILWESTLLPDQQNPGVPLYTVVLWIPTSIDQVMCGSFQIPDPTEVTREHIDTTMEHFLGQLFEARSQLLAQAAQEATQGGQDSQQSPKDLPAIPRGGKTPSGLYVV